MGVDQVAAIRPIVAELEEATSDAALQVCCGSFAVPGRDGLWVELVLGSVNCAYPYCDDPLIRVQELALERLPGLALSEWEPGKFATFDYDRAATRREVARFIDGWFGRILGCGDDYPLDVAIASLT
jgi:hypothetical protein